MDSNLLLETARKLVQPGKSSSEEFDSRSQGIAEKLANRMKKRPDLKKLVGKDGIPMMEDNSRNMIRFMNSVFKMFEPQTLVDTCCWAFVTYRSHGFQVAYWPAHLDTVVEICREELTPECLQEIEPFFEWIIVSIPLLTKVSDTMMSDTKGSD